MGGLNGNGLLNAGCGVAKGSCPEGRVRLRFDCCKAPLGLNGTICDWEAVFPGVCPEVEVGTPGGRDMAESAIKVSELKLVLTVMIPWKE